MYVSNLIFCNLKAVVPYSAAVGENNVICDEDNRNTFLSQFNNGYLRYSSDKGDSDHSDVSHN